VGVFFMGDKSSFVDVLELLADQQVEVRVSWTGFDWIKLKLDNMDSKAEEEVKRETKEGFFVKHFVPLSQGVIIYAGEDFIWLGRAQGVGDNVHTLPRVIPIKCINHVEILGSGNGVIEKLK